MPSSASVAVHSGGNPLSAIETQGGPAPLEITHTSNLSSFLGLSLKNGLLNLVTLTLYRFWGKTEVRRRVWSHTTINGDPLEYTGRGMELFLGFLIATFAIGLPFLLVIFGAQLLGPAVAAVIILPVYLVMFFLFGFGVFTAFRYMASRTLWRGVRWHLSGSPANYGLTYLGYTLLSAVTFGWFWPAAARRLSGELWGGLRFGDLPFQFDLDAARREKVYGAYALGWVIVLVGYFAFVGTMVGMLAAVMPTDETTPPDIGALATIYIGLLAFAVVAAVAFAPYSAAALRSVAAGVRLGDATFRLDLKWTDMAWLTISNFVLVLVSLGLLMPFVQARTTRFLIQRLKADGSVDLERVTQTADAGPRTAEGLADAFGSSLI